MASKKDRVPALIMRNISEIIQFEVKNAAIGFVTVTDVQVSNDFSHAKVYVTFLGKGQSIEKRMEALEHAKGFIRSSLSQRIDIRKVPELHFFYDDSYERSQKLEESLKKEADALQKLKKN